jgi:hypothetical protein
MMVNRDEQVLAWIFHPWIQAQLKHLW